MTPCGVAFSFFSTIGIVAMNLLGTSGVASAQVPLAAASPPASPLGSAVLQFHSTCLSEGEFVSKVTSRLQRPLSQLPNSPRYHVSILGPTEKRQVLGVVDILLRDARVVRRHVTGTNCSAVGDALAIVVAVSLEAGDTQEPSEIPMVLMRPQLWDPAAKWALGGGVSGIVTDVLETGPLLGVAGQVQVRFWTDAADPMLSVGLYRFNNVRAGSDEREIHLNLTFARLTVWPAELTLGESFELRPGIISELGEIEAAEARLPGGRVWWSGGADLSLAWVSSWMSVTGDVGAVLPLETQTFSSRGSSEPIHRIRSLGVFAQIGAVLWIL